MYRSRKVISVCIEHVLQWKGQDRYTHWSLSSLGTCTSIKRARSIYTLITFLAWYIYFNKKVKIDTHTDHFRPFYWSICTKPGKWSVCASILPFLLKYMYQARKVISVYIDLALYFEVHVVWYMYFNKKRQDQYTHWSLSWLGTCTSMKRARSIYTLITFLAWYMYFNKKGKIDIHTDHFPGLVHVLVISVCIDLALFIDVYVPIQESDQCVHRSCPFYWSTCTKPGKWSVCISILPF
jgi:hypothetical protein